MKTRNKALLLTLCALMLVAASVLGTMAYLTSTETVTNTFTVGQVKITLDEAKVGTDGKALTGDSAERVQANSYKLMPGHVYDKDPTVHVASNSEDCYLFVKVENGITDIEAENETVADGYKTITSQMAAKGWKAVDGQTGLYVYVGTAASATNPLAVKAGSDVTVFEKIKIKGDVDGTELQKYTNKTITVTAYAVQKDGFESSTAAQIWTAAFTTTTESAE